MDMYINPTTRDYELLSGMLVRGGLLTACYLRLSVPLGSWWADLTLGSKLHTLAREKDVPRMAKLAQQYAEQALEPILMDGRATSITVQAVQPKNGQMWLLVEVVAASGETLTFKHPVGVI